MFIDSSNINRERLILHANKMSNKNGGSAWIIIRQSHDSDDNIDIWYLVVFGMVLNR